MIQYQSALININNEEVLIDIEDAKEMDTEFFCPFCHGEMIPRCGEKNEKHFAHKRKECDYDMYLHTVAELKIQKWLKESQEILLSLPYKKACSESVKCDFYDRGFCTIDAEKKYNLKEWYKECDREKEIIIGEKKFKPDLLWHHKDNEKPFFIEICVTHPCEEDKINSGIHIIEFIIETEDDINRIIGSTIRENENVRLYNFKAQDDEIDKQLHKLDKLHKFTLFSTHKTFVDYYSLCRYEPTLSMDCKSYKLRRGIFEITIRNSFNEQMYNEGGLELIGLSVASQYIKTLKHCSLCKNQTIIDGIIVCKLRLGRGDKYLTCKDAAKCPDFQMGKEIINRRIDVFNKYRQTFYADIWLAHGSRNDEK